MAQPRVGGVIALRVNGVQYRCKGNVEYSINPFERSLVIGQDGAHGYMEKPRVQYIQATLTDVSDLDTRALMDQTAATVALELSNGKTVGLRDAIFTGDGSVTTAESELTARWEGVDAFEVL